MKQSLSSIFAVAALVTITTAHPPFTDNCGAIGYDSKVEGYRFLRKGTYDDCSAACQKDIKNCKSFSFGNNAKECNLYNVPLAGNFVKDRYSPYWFFEASCITEWGASTTTSATTSSKVAATTTSSKALVTTTSSTKGSATTVTSTTPSPSSSQTTKPTTLTTTTKPNTLVTSSTKVTSATSTTLSSSTLTPPCPVPTWVVSNFVYFNSSHNLDCAGADFNNELCYTGKPPQPAGYGPPDYVDASISDIGTCHQQNPGTTPRRAVGSDVVRCSGSSFQFAFYGNSNSASSVAHFDIQNPFTCPDGSSWYASGGLDFQMSCTYDSGKNATCTPASGSTVSVPANKWSCNYGCN